MRVFQIRCFISSRGVRYRPYEKVTKYKTRWFQRDKTISVWERIFLYLKTPEGYRDTDKGFESADQVMEVLTSSFGRCGFAIEEWEPK